MIQNNALKKKKSRLLVKQSHLNFFFLFKLCYFNIFIQIFSTLVEFLVFTFGFETIIPTFVFVLVPQLNRFRGSQAVLGCSFSVYVSVD